ncbi:MAG: glycosyltransferase [Alphaproteobacteria bacterium]|nr:glycosyltransferase [Alphaproteobacteria bacterium]MDE2494514.1 glycosyltransferase [Alphaproteobacteria bacterium]
MLQCMISVVIPTQNSQATLTRCFDSLIGATAHGVAREVIVADGASTDDTLFIADAAGAHVVQAGKSRASQLAAGAKAARGDWILFLHPETALEPGWDVEAEAFIARVSLERPRAAAFRFGLDDFDARSRRLEAMVALRCWLFKLPYGNQGLLIPRRLYNKLGDYRDTAAEDVDLVRRIGARRLVLLRARAVNKAEATPCALRRRALTILHALRLPAGVLARLG